MYSWMVNYSYSSQRVFKIKHSLNRSHFLLIILPKVRKMEQCWPNSRIWGTFWLRTLNKTRHDGNNNKSELPQQTFLFWELYNEAYFLVHVLRIILIPNNTLPVYLKPLIWYYFLTYLSKVIHFYYPRLTDGSTEISIQMCQSNPQMHVPDSHNI